MNSEITLADSVPFVYTSNHQTTWCIKVTKTTPRLSEVDQLYPNHNGYKRGKCKTEAMRYVRVTACCQMKFRLWHSFVVQLLFYLTSRIPDFLHKRSSIRILEGKNVLCDLNQEWIQLSLVPFFKDLQEKINTHFKTRGLRDIYFLEKCICMWWKWSTVSEFQLSMLLANLLFTPQALVIMIMQ